MADAKAKEPVYKLKQKEGALHIGGGRFFYPNETYAQKEFKGFEKYFEAVVEEPKDATGGKEGDK